MTAKPESRPQPSPRQELMTVGAGHLALRLSTDPGYVERTSDDAWQSLSPEARRAISEIAARSFPDDLHARARETQDLTAIVTSLVEFTDIGTEIDADISSFFASINGESPDNQTL